MADHVEAYPSVETVVVVDEAPGVAVGYLLAVLLLLLQIVASLVLQEPS